MCNVSAFCLLLINTCCSMSTIFLAMRYCEPRWILVIQIKSLKVFRLKAAILGLQFVKSMMFNCWNPSPREPKGTQGNPREPKGTSLGDPW